MPENTTGTRSRYIPRSSPWPTTVRGRGRFDSRERRAKTALHVGSIASPPQIWRRASVHRRTPSAGRKADARMAAIAEWLAAAGAAPAKVRLHHPRHHAPRAANDFQIAAYLQGAIRLRVDRQRTIAPGKHFRLPGRRFAGGGKPDVAVRTVAKRLVLRSTAAA